MTENYADFSKITLKKYYESLPKVQHPKTELLRMIMDECHVSESTARNWVKQRVKPMEKEYIEALTKITGIPKQNLFA